MKEYRINQFLSVRLEREPWVEKKTMIYVAGQPFIQCKSLLLNIPISEIATFDEIESIDEAAEKANVFVEKEMQKIEITPEVEFWGHCSNLQVWYENGYDTHLLHSNIAFPLLGKLSEVGDPLAKKVFQKEIFKRYEEGTEKTREFIRNGGVLNYLPIEEQMNLLLDTENLIALMEIAEEVWPEIDIYEIVQDLINEERVKLENRRVIKLDFSGLSLELVKFPKAILDLESLRYFVFGGNYITELPENINKLKNLKELEVSSNKLTCLPKSICEITSLEKLWLGENKIHNLPENIGDFTNLKTLDLGLNQLKELPESFSKLISLEDLSLSSNKLQAIPKSFCKLKSLKRLSISSNILNKLPECIGDMPLLEYLDVSSNPLANNLETVEKLKKSKIKKIDGIGN